MANATQISPAAAYEALARAEEIMAQQSLDILEEYETQYRSMVGLGNISVGVDRTRARELVLAVSPEKVMRIYNVDLRWAQRLTKSAMLVELPLFLLAAVYAFIGWGAVWGGVVFVALFVCHTAAVKNGAIGDGRRAGAFAFLASVGAALSIGNSPRLAFFAIAAAAFTTMLGRYHIPARAIWTAAYNDPQFAKVGILAKAIVLRDRRSR